MTQTAYLQNARLGRGVNIIGYDRIWQEPENGRFKQRYFGMIKQAGFQHVRVNIHAFKAMETQAPYTINNTFLGVMDWTIENALANDLVVILDMHEFGAMGKDPEGLHDRYLSFWKQVAARVKDAPDSVYFELLNEPHGKLTEELWNAYLMEAYSVIRDSNPDRTLIIGPGQWNNIDCLKTLVLPEDDRNIISTVHYYRPMDFTHQGAPWSPENVDKSGIEWHATPDALQTIRNDFAVAQAWSEAQQRPLYLGEFGAYDKADMASRARYTNAVCRIAEELGWSWGYWQFDSDFIVYNIDAEQWVAPIRDALIPQESSVS